MIFFKLFLTFFKIGLFGFGGGYAMISLIHDEVVLKNHWISSAEFTDIVAISQMTPGPIGINSATYCGYTALMNDTAINQDGQLWLGILGSVAATVSLILPSLILMMLISAFFMRYRKHPVVEMVFSGLRPAVVGLLAAAALCLMTQENFSAPDVNAWQFWISTALFCATFIGTRKFKIHPILMICLCGIAGLLLL
ncbi:MAG: chromate transporter [Bacteroidales bacterium]|nr:chromate transporter [Bacteroidales bacterium]